MSHTQILRSESIIIERLKIRSKTRLSIRVENRKMQGNSPSTWVPPQATAPAPQSPPESRERAKPRRWFEALNGKRDQIVNCAVSLLLAGALIIVYQIITGTSYFNRLAKCSTII